MEVNFTLYGTGYDKLYSSLKLNPMILSQLREYTAVELMELYSVSMFLSKLFCIQIDG